MTATIPLALQILLIPTQQTSHNNPSRLTGLWLKPALSPQFLDGRHNCGCHIGYRFISIDLSEPAQRAIVFDYRRSLSLIRAPATDKALFCIVASLLESRAF
jgi:hypothetical protein